MSTLIADMLKHAQHVDYLNLSRSVFVIHMYDGTKVFVQHDKSVFVLPEEWAALCELIRLRS